MKPSPLPVGTASVAILVLPTFSGEALELPRAECVLYCNPVFTSWDSKPEPETAGVTGCGRKDRTAKFSHTCAGKAE